MKKEILELKNKNDLDKIDNFISNSVLEKKFPLIKGVPFCCMEKPMHSIDLYGGTGKGKKTVQCTGCKLKSWCDYDDGDFNIIPIKDPDKDMLKFLEERHESFIDWI